MPTLIDDATSGQCGTESNGKEKVTPHYLEIQIWSTKPQILAIRQYCGNNIIRRLL